MIKVSVCICTYKRNELLRELLVSLSKQSYNHKYNIIVVDNSCDAEAEKLILDFNEQYGCQIVYENEPQQGISYARNRCVKIANKLESDYVAFIDDDEIASIEWLNALVSTALDKQCDVVLGPVLSIFPENSKDYLVNSNIFKRKLYDDKSQVCSEEGRAGNVLIKCSWLNVEQPFKIELSKSGSEDYQFFNAIGKQGAIFYWSAEAVVSEIVPLSRQRVGWILERRLRSGINYWRINYPSYSFMKKFKIAAIGLAMIVPLAVVSAFLFPISKIKCINISIKLMSMISRVMAFTKIKMAGY